MPKNDIVLTLEPDTAIDILNKTLDRLHAPDTVLKVEEARKTVGNEMLKMMQYIFPIVMQIQIDVLKEFSFPEGREGIIKFAQLLRALEREDTEIARLHGLIKSYYLPSVSVNATSDSNVEDRIIST